MFYNIDYSDIFRDLILMSKETKAKINKLYYIKPNYIANIIKMKSFYKWEKISPNQICKGY